MKKYLPIILLFAGVIILVTAFIFVGGRSEDKKEVSEEEAGLLDLPIEKRPVVLLTPTSDGHYLNLKIEKIGFSPSVLDLEFLYTVPGQEQPQGSAPSINIKGKDIFEIELLLGTESSGKFRYDEGVEKGSLTLRFRNEEGKLLVRYATEFNLQTNTDLLISPDGIFKYKLESVSKNYFVTMNTIGLPDGYSDKVNAGPYGIFTSSESEVKGDLDVEFKEIVHWDGGSWTKLETKNSPDVGIFVDRFTE